MFTAKTLQTSLIGLSVSLMVLASVPSLASISESELDITQEMEYSSSKVDQTPTPDLPSAGELQYFGSDEASKNFQETQLPKLSGFIKGSIGNLSPDSGYIKLDPSKLVLSTAADVRVYFVDEKTGYQNMLGVDGSTPGAIGDDAAYVFSNVQTNHNKRGPGQNNPLLPGDFVNIGKRDAGSLLDFFLVSDGANNSGKNKGIFGSVAEMNPDKMPHMVSYLVPNSSLIMVGFEDSSGAYQGELNDNLFAVDIGQANHDAMAGTEPGTILMIAGMLTPVALNLRNRKRATLTA